MIDINKLKLVIWDLDDTFWTGTLSEGEIKTIPENMQVINTLVDHGVMNSICSKNDFEKVDLRIKKITEQTVEQIEIDSELPPTIEQLEDNNRTYSIMAAILFIDIRK